MSAIRINPFNEPRDASGWNVGITGTTMACLIGDELSRILAEVEEESSRISEETGLDIRSGVAIPVLANPVTVADVKVEVRGFSISTLVSLWNLIRQSQYVVSGDLVHTTNRLWIRVRTTDSRTWERAAISYGQLTVACRDIVIWLMEYCCPPIVELVPSSHGPSTKPVDTYKRWVKREPKNVQAHYYLGGALASEGLFDQAVIEYQHALRLRRQSAEVWYAYGATLESKGNVAGAKHAYRQAINVNPGFAAALNSLGALLLDENNVSQAIPLLEKALKSQPEFPRAIANLVNAYMKVGRYDDATRFLGDKTF